MAVSIRLKMLGTKHRPFYRIVAMDSRKTRDGKSLAILGQYAPLYHPPEIKIEEEQVLDYLNKGAQPSETVRNLLRQNGIKQQQQAKDGHVKKVWVKTA